MIFKFLVFFSPILLLLLSPPISAINFDQWGVRPKAYYCAYGSCMSMPRDAAPRRNDSPSFFQDAGAGVGLDACHLTCGAKGHIWPQPTGQTQLANFTKSLDIRNIWSNDQTLMATTLSMFNIFKQNVRNQYNKFPGVNQGVSLLVNIQAIQPNQSLVLTQTDESYSLEIRGCELSSQQVIATIIGGSIWGARHGLETLSQLIGYDDVNESLRVACNATINDNPVYPYRGLSLDVSRRFYPVDTIKKMLHGMGIVKMNVLHLHLSDSQSFPVAIKNRPQMLYYGSYGPNQGYSSILIIPEIDAPSHVGEGWQWGPKMGLGDLLMCWETLPSETCISTPCGYLNPLNKNVYDILYDIYNEILNIFGNPVDPSSNWFHIGSDEVDLNACWNTNPETVKWMKQFTPPKNGYDLWGLFENTAIKNLKKANDDTLPNTILWTSHLTNNGSLMNVIDKQYHTKIIIESWEKADDTGLLKFLNNGFRMIMAPYDAWYLDCGSGWWVGEGGSWCDPIKDWRRMYNYRPTQGFNGTYNITDQARKKLILGGEGGIWSETIGPENVDQKVWPRAAAIAERLWSDPEHCWYYANSRMFAMRDRLVRLGINAEPIQPEWCDQNGANCIVDATLWNFYHINPRSTCLEFQNMTIPTANHRNSQPSSVNQPFASPLIGNEDEDNENDLGVVLRAEPMNYFNLDQKPRADSNQVQQKLTGPGVPYHFKDVYDKFVLPNNFNNHFPNPSIPPNHFPRPPNFHNSLPNSYNLHNNSPNPPNFPLQNTHNFPNHSPNPPNIPNHSPKPPIFPNHSPRPSNIPNRVNHINPVKPPKSVMQPFPGIPAIKIVENSYNYAFSSDGDGTLPAMHDTSLVTTTNSKQTNNNNKNNNNSWNKGHENLQEDFSRISRLADFYADGKGVQFEDVYFSSAVSMQFNALFSYQLVFVFILHLFIYQWHK